MSNIGFSELLFIFILAFVILGPEKLPKAAYSLGLIIKKIKQQYNNFQTELNQSFELDHTKSNTSDSLNSNESKGSKETHETRVTISSKNSFENLDKTN